MAPQPRLHNDHNNLLCNDHSVNCCGHYGSKGEVQTLEWTTEDCRIFATELEDGRPKTVPYLEEVVE